jgi:hypothetical protein
MKNYTQVIITKLDSGYLVSSENEVHSILSKDKMIAKVRELLDISTTPKKKISNDVQTTSLVTQSPHPTITKEQIDDTKSNDIRCGILSDFTDSKNWPIKQSECLVPELISIPTNENVRYAETSDERIHIKYKTGRINTTWAEITGMLDKIKPGSELLHVPPGFSSNQRTCIRQFMLAIREGLKPGDSVELDPDKDFRKQLDRSSQPEYERGTLKEIIT